MRRPWTDPQPDLDAVAAIELARARRHRRPMTVVTISVRERPRRLPPRGTYLRRLVGALRHASRDIDHVGALTGSRMVALLPETSGEGALDFVRRVRGLLDPQAEQLAVGLASFPDEEVTWFGLKTLAMRREQGLDELFSDEGGENGGPSEREEPATRPPELGRRSGVSSAVLRRVVDVLAVLVVAPVVLALVALLAAAIKLDSAGPVVITHERLGRGGRRFRLLKLRTMVCDASERKAALAHLNELPWPDFKIANDPRVTRVGRWLRKTSLDEVPQLWNVLRGEMTLVGPRPCSIGLDAYELWQTERLEDTPGLFGRWQCDARAAVSFEDRCRMDISQLRSRSLRSSAVLTGRTIWAVLTARHGT